MSNERLSSTVAAVGAALLLAACTSAQDSSSTPTPQPPTAAAPPPLTSAVAPQSPTSAAATPADSPVTASSSATATSANFLVVIGSQQYSATLADTDAARAFSARFPLTVDMHDVNSNEKAFGLPDELPAAPTNPGTVRTGDVMLYGTDTLVLFYESFDTSYTYSTLGSLDAPGELFTARGTGDVTVTFTR